MISDKDMLLLVLLFRGRRRRREGAIKKKSKRVWVREIFLWRKEQGEFHNLVRERRLGDREFYFRYEIRMTCNYVKQNLVLKNKREL